MVITPEQTKALGAGKAVIVQVAGHDCVLVPLQVFQQMSSGEEYDDSEWSLEEVRAVLARSATENGWDEPGMDEYDRYDEIKE